MSRQTKTKVVEEYLGSGISGLLFAIIVQAGKDKDIEWLHSPTCYDLCRLLNLRHRRIVKAVL